MDQPLPEQQPAPTTPAPSAPVQKKSRKWAYAAIIIVAFAAGFFIIGFPLSGFLPTGMIAGNTAGIVKEGSAVKVWYTGKLEDGTVFDTNIQTVAQKAGIERGEYKPLEFTVGSKQVIPGFEKGVIGMKSGEKKTLTLKPEEAYGQPDPKFFANIPRTQELNRTDSVPLVTKIPADQFLAYFGQKAMGERFSVPNSDLEYEVLNVSDTFVFSKIIIEEGKEYQFPGFNWKSEIVEIEGENVKVRHNPAEGPLNTSVGTADITVTEDKIIITSSPTIGQKISTPYGAASVSAINEANITLDFNHELAGKTLIFEIEMAEFK